MFTSTTRAVGSIVMSTSVCLCVCMSDCKCICLSFDLLLSIYSLTHVRISPQPHAPSLPNFGAWPLGPPRAWWRNIKGSCNFGVFFPTDNALYSIAFATHTKRLNWSRCRLVWWLGWALGTMCFCSISVARQHQHYSVLLVLIRNIGRRMLAKIWVGTILVRNVQPSGKTFNWL